MSKIFNSVPGNRVKRNVFNLSHERKMSMNMGQLIPMLMQEVVPGDTFRVDSEIMMRLAPMLAPVMHRVNVYTHYFFVPNRIIWNEWEDFITGNGTPVFPKIRVGEESAPDVKDLFTDEGTLPDYMGFPTYRFPSLAGASDFELNALPFRAYQKIYNEYYRDQDLVEEVDISDASGITDEHNETLDLLTIRRRAWEKDYFTSARPWAQKGDSVELPLTGSADIVYNDDPLNTQILRSSNNSSTQPNANLQTKTSGILTNDVNQLNSVLDLNGTHKVDLSSATASTINELRRAFQLQKWLERNARSGSRYTEVLQAHFGVKSSDARLQRPEYLGGGRQAVSISEVLQTSEATLDSPLGAMSGHGISVGRSNRFKRFFEEHGYVIGIVSVLPRTAYQQGIPKIFRKFDKFDYFWPEFQHIGEQEIKNYELFWNNDEVDEETFGYTPRYAEYKQQPSSVHGDFRNDLKYWHMGRVFDSRPNLNDLFVTAVPTTRIFNVTDINVDKLWVQIYNNVKAVRPMAVYGEPGLIDH